MTDRWFYSQNKQKLGPFDLKAMKQLLASGQLQATDMIWQEGTPKWISASTLGIGPTDEQAPGAAPIVPPECILASAAISIAPQQQALVATASAPPEAIPVTTLDQGGTPQQAVAATPAVPQYALVAPNLGSRIRRQAAALASLAMDESKKTAEATCKATAHLGSKAKRSIQGRSLSRACTAAQLRLGQRLHEIKSGDPDLLSEIASLDETSGGSRAIKFERRELLLRLAATTLATFEPPQGAEQQFLAARNAESSLQRHMQEQTQCASPAISWGRSLFGFAAAFSLILVFALLIGGSSPDEFDGKISDEQQPFIGSNSLVIAASKELPTETKSKTPLDKDDPNNTASPSTDKNGRLFPNVDNLTKKGLEKNAGNSTSSPMPTSDGINTLQNQAKEPVMAATAAESKFTPLDIRSVATVPSTRIFNQESLLFPAWRNQAYYGVPFMLIDPEGGTIKNVICLYSRLGAVSRKMPQSVRLACDLQAKVIHFLGAAGWGVPWTKKGTPSMLISLEYADGEKEDHRLLNGIHLTDWALGPDVPESKSIGVLKMRYFSVAPKRQSQLRAIHFRKGTDQTSPFVMAVTVERPVTEAAQSSKGPPAKTTKQDDTQERLGAALKAKKEATEKAERERLVALAKAEREREAAAKQAAKSGLKSTSSPKSSAAHNVTAESKIFQHKGVVSLAYSPNGRYLTTASFDAIIIWDLNDGKETRKCVPEIKEDSDRLYNTPKGARDVAFSNDGKFVFAHNWRTETANLKQSVFSTAFVFDRNSGKQIRYFDLGESGFVTFSADGELLVYKTFKSKQVDLRKSETGQVVHQFDMLKIRGTDVADMLASTCVSPDNKRLLLAGGYGRLYSLEDGKEIRVLQWPDNQFTPQKAVFCSDGKRALMASNRKVTMLNTESGKEEHVLEGSFEGMWTMAVAPNGRLALGGAKRTAILWNLETGKQVRRHADAPANVTCVAFSPSGDSYAVCAGDSVTVHVVHQTATREKNEKEAVGVNAKPTQPGAKGLGVTPLEVFRALMVEKKNIGRVRVTGNFQYISEELRSRFVVLQGVTFMYYPRGSDVACEAFGRIKCEIGGANLSLLRKGQPLTVTGTVKGVSAWLEVETGDYVDVFLTSCTFSFPK